MAGAAAYHRFVTGPTWGLSIPLAVHAGYLRGGWIGAYVALFSDVNLGLFVIDLNYSDNTWFYIPLLAWGLVFGVCVLGSWRLRRYEPVRVTVVPSRTAADPRVSLELAAGIAIEVEARRVTSDLEERIRGAGPDGRRLRDAASAEARGPLGIDSDGLGCGLPLSGVRGCPRHRRRVCLAALHRGWSLMDYAHPELLADTAWLAEHLKDANVRVIDCAMLEGYRRAHIPGALHLPTHYYIKEADPDGSDHGVLVMPQAELEALMSKLGVSNDTLVVAYDDNNGFIAARLWWVLNYYGHSNVKVLNGGWHRWLTEGRPVTFHASKATPATFSAKPRPELYCSIEMLKSNHADPGTQVMDVRTDAEWNGTNDRGNKRAGHVPQAKHLNWERFVSREDTRELLPADQIQQLLDGAGISRDRPVITYCQGGIRAAMGAFVLSVMGYERVRVYDGSMREWANREDTPLVV